MVPLLSEKVEVSWSNLSSTNDVAFVEPVVSDWLELETPELAFRILSSFVISSASLESIFIAETSTLTAGAFPDLQNASTQHLADEGREYQI